MAQEENVAEESTPAEDLHTAFSPDNDIKKTDAPFGSGGDGNE